MIYLDKLFVFGLLFGELCMEPVRYVYIVFTDRFKKKLLLKCIHKRKTYVSLIRTAIIINLIHFWIILSKCFQNSLLELKKKMCITSLE